MKILMSKTLSGQLKPCYDSDAELLKKIKAGDEIELSLIHISEPTRPY